MTFQQPYIGFLVASKLWIAGLISLILFTCNLSAAHMSAEEFKSIQIASESIMEKFPPAEYIYLGVGRSPTPIVAYLSLVVPKKQVSQIPYSRAKETETDYNRKIQDSTPYMLKEIQIKHKNLVMNHFDEYIPKLLKTNPGKKIVFIDYVVNGSFKSFLNIAKIYFEKHQKNVTFEHLALLNEISLIGKEEWLGKNNTVFLDSLHRDFTIKLRGQSYDRISPVAFWSIYHTDVNLEKKQLDAYQNYYEKLRSNLHRQKSCKVGFNK